MAKDTSAEAYKKKLEQKYGITNGKQVGQVGTTAAAAVAGTVASKVAEKNTSSGKTSSSEEYKKKLEEKYIAPSRTITVGYDNPEAKEYERLRTMYIPAVKQRVAAIDKEIANLNVGTASIVASGANRGQKGSSYNTDIIDKKKKLIAERNRLTQDITLASRLQTSEKLRNDALNDDEFRLYATRGIRIENPTVKEAEGFATIFGKPIGGESIGNKVTYSRDNWQEIAAGEAQNHRMQGKSLYHYMTDEEVQIYNYYLAKHGEEKADKYLDSIEETLNYRQAGQVVSNGKNIPGFEIIVGGSAGLEQAGSGFRGAVKMITGDDSYTPTSSTQYASQMVREDLADAGPKLPDWAGGASLGQAGYDLLTNTAHMVPSIMVGTLTGGAGGAITMGVSASGSAYTEMINLGYDKSQASAYGLLVGASEAGLSYALGGITRLGGKVSGSVINNLVSKVDNAVAKIAIEYGGKLASEFTEEYLQEVLEPFYRNLAFMEENEIKLLTPEAIYAGILGALTAGFLEGPSTVYSNTMANREAMSTYGESATELIEEGLSTPKGTRSHELATEYKAKLDQGKTLSSAEIRMMVEANEQQFTAEDTAKIQEAAENRLRELGESDNVEAIAQILAKQAGGETITKAQQKVLDASTYGQRVGNELNPQNIQSGGYASDWTRDIGTNRINADLYNLAQETAGAKKAQDAPTATQEKAGVKIDSSETNSLPKDGKAVQGEFEVSDNGKTFNLETGEDIKISDIASIKDGKMTLKLEDGTEVSTDKVSFPSVGDALVYETVANLPNINAAAANVLVKNLELSDVSANVYARGIEEAYRYGMYNIPATEMLEKGAFSADLSSQQRMQAYQLGQSNYKASIKAKSEAVRKNRTTAKKTTEGKVHYDKTKAYNERQKASIEALEKIAEALGTEFYLYESKVVNGKRQGANGWIDNEGIHIDIFAGQNGEATMLFTASHELTHFIKKWSPEKFKTLADFLMEEYGKEGVSVNELVRAQQEKARNSKEHPRELSYDVAFEEVVADSMETMLTDGKVMEKLAKLKAQDQTLWQKIKSFIDDLVKKIKEVYEGLTPNSEEGQYVAEMKDSLERFQELFTEGLVEASENFQIAGVEIGNELSVNDVIESGGNDGVVAKFQERTEYEAAPKQIFTISTTNGTSKSKMLTNKDGSNKLVSVKELRDQKFKENHFTDKEIDKMNKFVKTLADYMEEARVKYRFIGLQDVYDAKIVLDPMTNSIVLSAMVKNSEYSVNFDFTKICKKRVALQEVIEQLTREKGRKNEDGGITEVDLSPANIKAINDILAKMGFETACLGCFVESKRYAMQNFYQDLVVDVWNRLVDEVSPNAEYFGFADQDVNVSKIPDNEFFDLQKQSKAWAEKKGKAKDVEQKMREYLHDNPAARKKLSLADLATANGRTNLAKLYPHVDSLIKSKLGQSAPKSVEVFTPYNGEIELLEATGDGNLAEYLQKIGGARSQSFSDFIITHVFDVLQKTASLSARKFTAHTYTKEIVRAQLFGLTGEKHNLSVIHNVDPDVDSWNAGLGKDGQYLNADYEAYMKGESDFVQSIGVKDAIKWQNTEGYSRDIGIIAVGFSYNHMMKMHDDPEIRQIIGYHASQLPVDIKDKTHLGKAADYTHVQNTLQFKGFRVVNYKTPNGVPSYATPPQDIKETSGVKSLTKSTELTFDIKAKFEENAKGKTGKARTEAAKKTLRQFLEFADINNLVPVVSKAEGALGEFDIYADSEKTQNPYLTADHYIEYCMERGYLPAFFEFGLHQNYYKNIYDFDPFDRLSYNPKTGLHEDSESRKAFAPQRPVHMLNEDGSLAFPDNFIEIVDKAMKGYDKQRQSESEMMPEALEKIRAITNSTKFSDRDSDGRELSAEQAEFFKDSKARDENGNLLTMYHGTANGGAFTIFEGDKLSNKTLTSQIGQGFYFTNVKEEAQAYMRNRNIYGKESKGSNPYLHEVYLNITNPLNVEEDIDLDAAKAVYRDGDYDWFFDSGLPHELNNRTVNGVKLTRAEVQNMSKEEKASLYVDYLFQIGGTREVLQNMPKAFHYERQGGLLEAMKKKLGHDGIVDEFKPGKFQYVAFSSEQIKQVDNKTPTTDPDIRYSLRSSYDKEGMSEKDIEAADKVIKDLRLKGMMARYGVAHTAAYTAERIERELNYSSANSLDYAKSYVAWVKPSDFVFATTVSDRNRETLKEEAGTLDVEKLSKESQPIYLVVDFENGRILGHEGRHRMLALEEAGINEVAVIIDARNDDTYNTKPVEYMRLEGQHFSDYEKGVNFGVSSMLPLSARYANVAKELFTQETESGIRYSLREEAPTFYSNMGKVVDGIKTEKVGANGVVPYLKGKGVKAEELKWSGIEAFLEGKKSVTKQELKEFVEGSMLQIGEAVKEDSSWKPKVKKLSADSVALYSNGELVDTFTKLEEGYWVPSNRIGKEFYVSEKSLADDYKEFHEIGTNWSQYKLDGGKNYRELLFKLPNSNYSNNAMRGHWGQDAKGILAHARVQDFKVGGKNMLFIEEIQSDWHNEGNKKGYDTKGVKTDSDIRNESATAFHDFVNSNVMKSIESKLQREGYGDTTRLFEGLLDGQQFAYDTLMEYVGTLTATERSFIQKAAVAESKRQADAQKAPSAIGVEDAPFRNNYHEFVLKRLIREAAEKGYDIIGWTTADIQSDRWSDDFAEGYRIEYDQDIPKFLNKYGKKWGAQVGKATIRHGFKGTEVWSMPITDAMRESVISEGQPLYQDRSDPADRNRAVILQNKAERLEKELADLERAYKKAQDYARAEGILAGQIEQGAQMAKELRQKQESFNRKVEGYEKTISDKRKQIAEVRAQRDELLAKAKAEKREAVANARQRALETQREIISRYQESRKKAVEGRHQTEMRHKIKGVVNELNQLLLHGTKDRHVMTGLQKAVAEALDVVNMDTIGAAERIAKYDALIAKANDPDVIASLTATRDRIKQQGDNLSEKIAQLKAAYGDIENSDDPDIANGYDEVIASKIASVVSTVGNTPLKAMSMEQLENVYDMYRMVLTRIREANRSFAMAKKENISTLAGKVMMEVEKVGGKHDKFRVGTDKIRGFMWNNTKPVYAFEHIGSKTLTDVFKNVRKGEDTWAKDVTEAKEFLQKESNKYHYDRWNMDKAFSFKSKAGQNFKLTLEQIMSLYAYSKRQQADKHLELGGFVFDSNIEVVEKKKGIPVKYKVNTATAHQINKEILSEIIGKLTPEQKAFVDEMQDYLSTTMGGKGNEVSMAMYGVKLFKEKFYFPLKSAKQFMFEQNQTAGEVKVKNSGFSKETVVNAGNPIILSNFMDVWSNHVNDMSMYHAFVLPLEDFNRVFNYKTPTTEGLETESVKQFIQNAYGEEANKYISELIKDLNGGAMSDPRETMAKRLIGNFKKAAVFTSASVVIQQPSAIGRALALLDSKYFIGGKIGAKGHKKSWEEVKKYAPVAMIKEMGYFDTDMARSTVDFITAKEYSKLGKVKGFFTDSAYRDELLSIAPAKADEVTWVAIWNAVKRETKKKNPSLKPGSEEFLKAAGERFTEVITKTQVYDSVLSRSANMRSKSTFMNMGTAFMAEPTTSINMLEDALRQGKRGDKAYARKAIGAVYGSILLNSVLVSLVYAARDDEEDETYLEKYLESLTKEVTEGINPLTYLPFFKDIWSVMQGFDVERADMSLISKLVTSMQNAIKVYGEDTEDMTEEELAEHAKAVAAANWDIIDNISSLVGIPVKNIRRDFNAVINLFKTVHTDIMGRKSSFGSILDNIADGFKDSIPFVDGRETKADKLYEAIMAGDEVYEARLRESVPDYQLRGALRGNDPRIREAAQARIDGDTDTYLTLAREIIADGFSQNEVVRAINTQINEMVKEETAEEAEDKLYGFFGSEDYFKAILAGDQADALAIKQDIISTSIANGRDKSTAEEKFYGSLYYDVQDAFEDGVITAAKAKEIFKKYGGKTAEDAEETVDKWVFKAEYGFDYSDRADAYKSGEISRTELKKAIMDFGGKSAEEAELQIEVYDWQKAGIDIKSNQTYIIEDYKEYWEPNGISKGVYVGFYEETKDIKADIDSKGESIPYSKTKKIMPYINELPLTPKQKTAVAKSFGWADSTIAKYKLW